MYTSRAAMKTWSTECCHEGVGRLACVELLSPDPARTAGFRFMHDDTLAPGASIGEHTHTDDEEIYFIVEGHGVMLVDGVETPVAAGDMVITRLGHRHALTNSLDGPMRLIVVATNV
jgi:mannose-6-phosphate isomerase-like protein (cupin superfamily)